MQAGPLHGCALHHPLDAVAAVLAQAWIEYEDQQHGMTTLA
jgi:hypothetical protein